MASFRKTLKQTSLKELLYYLGPGFLISVAYMDPGNWATNISGGAQFGPKLLWVIVLASIVAIFIQINAAKLGIATGKGVATLCRERLSKPSVIILWAAAELAMIATDMAEIIGAAIGFSLIFKLPLWAGAVLAGISSFALLGIRTAHQKGYRVIEFVIMGMVSVVGIAFLFEMILAEPTLNIIATGMIPTLPNATALYVAIGIFGATVMPHSVYLHSHLVQDRRQLSLSKNEDEIAASHHRHFHFESFDTSTALFAAMFVNAAMLIVAAAALQGTGIETLDEAYITLENVFGPYSSYAFGIALISAGLSSSLVATMAGQTVMDGFLKLDISVWYRRSVTLIPSIIIVMIGFDATSVLVASQVALSFELPFVLIPLVMFTKNKEIMGDFQNYKITTYFLGLTIAFISVLNVWLIYSGIF